MPLKLLVNSSDPPIGALLVTEITCSKSKSEVQITWSNDLGKRQISLEFFDNDGTLLGQTSNDVARYLSRAKNPKLYGSEDPFEKTEVDHWLTISEKPFTRMDKLHDWLIYLDRALATRTWLVAKHLTIADICMFSKIYAEGVLKTDLMQEKYQNVSRWYKQMLSRDKVQKVLSAVSKNSTKVTSVNGFTKDITNKRKQEGKFVELPGAEMGKVVVRFPPEASGYLHIGHAKAALLNQYYAETFKGTLIMRFDDTNPAKENVEFEKAILEDLEMLQVKYDKFTHSSDYFDLMLQYCEKLIKEGKAFVDDTPAAQMKEQRDQKLPSESRSNSIEKNQQLWNEMIKGTEKGQECCVRAKIDYASLNGCLRDPTIYRCKPEPHPRTGTKYKVYPTYDFACPIVDAVEGVTHTLRTTEYHDRDEQFYWFINALNLNKPYIWEYSRLNMTNTVLSKRKLTWFVQEGLVDGWDDPRFPTVRGILRRGMTVEGLKQFIIAQGGSRSVVFMEWDKIWAFNKKVIDPVAIRYTAINNQGTVPVRVKGANQGLLTVANHPKDPSIGTKKVQIGETILIEQEDADLLVEGQNSTFINWGNLMIDKLRKEGGHVVEVHASLNLENKDFKNTLKLTWLSADNKLDNAAKNQNNLASIPCYAVYFDHIISKPVLAKDDDFKDFIAKDTRKEVQLIGESELRRVKKGEIIQLQRKGFFRCDVPYSDISVYSSKEQPLILFNIPDGHTGSSATPNNTAEKVKENTKKVSKDSKDVLKLIEEISQQGNKIRDLKLSKTEKSVIDTEVKILLNLKNKYKSLTGEDWKPVSNTASEKVSNSTVGVADAINLSDKIKEQGDIVRDLKAKKVEKLKIDEEVKTLLNLKTEYKKLTGKDWTPLNSETKAGQKSGSSSGIDTLNFNITEQGNKVRELKEKKSDKSLIKKEVDILLTLKSEYKKQTGQDWKPSVTPSKTPEASYSQTPVNSKEDLNKQIIVQGNKVRDLKSKKAEKSLIDEEVKILISLKANYKKLVGEDWIPQSSSTPAKEIKSNMGNENQISDLNLKIIEQGNKIRELKAQKADKSAIDQEVKTLLDLKNNYKNLSGSEWKPSNSSGQPQKKNNENKSKNSKSAEQKSHSQKEAKDTAESSKTGTRLGLEAKKNENLSDWYAQVITKGEMIEYYDVSGCYILRPWSFAIWDIIKDFFDKEIKKLGVQNCYFPIFVSRSALEREKEHITDFAPEVAWVTKSGESDLAEHIAIRPTSETVMYPAYAKWIKSHRDLPLKLNQWNNVVRWEFKHPQPFLRTREFLWQEGHTAFATKTEADEEVLIILDLYSQIYEDYLAIPVVKGRKTEKEKFAGGDYTTTVEAYISASGRAIQGGTSHHLGQNFSKMFDIQVENEGSEKIYIYQNSWGITTRTIGVMIMVHGDDKGLVIPPKVACVQAVIVPCGITNSTTQEQRQKLLEECRKLEKELSTTSAVRIKGDYRDNYSPGWKFNHWELKGVPVRIELGPKDLEKNQVTFVRRDTSERCNASRSSVLPSLMKLLDDIQGNLFAKAKQDLDSHIKQTTKWTEFCTFLDEKNLILAPFCGSIICEENIKTDSAREEAAEPGAPSMGAKGLCIPFKQPEESKNLSNLKCVHHSCQEKPKFFTLFGRSY